MAPNTKPLNEREQTQANLAWQCVEADIKVRLGNTYHPTFSSGALPTYERLDRRSTADRPTKQIDLNKWAALAGYDKPATATVMWRRLKHRLMELTKEDATVTQGDSGADNEPAAPTVQKKNSAPRKRKAPAKKDAPGKEDKNGEDAAERPAKKTTKRPKKTTPAAAPNGTAKPDAGVRDEEMQPNKQLQSELENATAGFEQATTGPEDLSAGQNDQA
ncbi:hypothetical protein NKR23_g1158 [Pleurostoma richardsiae]|uniref:Uncharacterized protein n=1 Tax=Pleurostoma richardsiae TaxID=41990 RepID=A0AA38S524_9PEZI|nr:hypothetical protein NKR23_g1158 [Pleurostoma richardsiae]